MNYAELKKAYDLVIQKCSELEKKIEEKDRKRKISRVPKDTKSPSPMARINFINYSTVEVSYLPDLKTGRSNTFQRPYR